MRTSTVFLPFFLPAAYGQLHTLATKAGLKYFGSATDNGELSDASYLAVLKNISEFGQITPGNTQKWQYTEPSQGSFSFTQGEVITSLARDNSQMLRCHNLVWYNQLPSWVSSGTWTNETLIAAMTEHITKEVTNWKGQCYAWDVVNEALDDSGNFRDDIFYKTIGPYYINIAFAAAAAADPSAKLYYNDYNIEYSGTKKTNALAIVNQIKNAGIRIDGVGIQGHYIVGSTPSQSSLESVLKEYTSLGVEVALTELDIRMKTNSAANLAQQSTEYAGVTKACLNVDECVGITLWDFDDKYSWVPTTFSGYGYACLWNEDLTKKPAYDGVVAALKSSSRTSMSSMSSTNSTSPASGSAGGTNSTVTGSGNATNVNSTTVLQRRIRRGPVHW